jgi:predicted nucleic acid-binding Zn ribbon protein
MIQKEREETGKQINLKVSTGGKMPSYDYKCPVCEEVEEFTFPLGKAPSEVGTHSPICNMPMKKVISLAAVSFRGSGFFKTDNRKIDVAS